MPEKVEYLSESLMPLFQDPILSIYNGTPPLKVPLSTTLLLLTVGNQRNEIEVTSSHTLFIQNFVKIVQLVQKLKVGTHMQTLS
jgi:hypothetical protein